MTAFAHRVDRVDRASRASGDERAATRGSCNVSWHGMWFAVAVLLACGGITRAEDPLFVTDDVPPMPAIDGAFDAGKHDVESVLVDDGQAGPIYPGHHADGEAWCDPCEAAWDAAGGDCRRGRRWAIQADALVLWRNNIAGPPLLLDSFGSVGLDAADVRTAAAAGPRIGVIRNLGCGRAVEGNWFNVGGIQGGNATDGLGAPYTAIGLADLPFSDIIAADYTTRGQIKSAEFNYRWSQGRRVIWLAGFRWIEWNETATVNYEFENPEPFGNGSIQSRVGNDLYGGQFGCRLRLWDLGKWQVSTVGKAGGYGNVAFQRTSVNGGVPPQPTIGAIADDVAFFGEVGVNSTLWLTNWLAWRAGYNFFWLEGVATAAQQLPLGSFGSETASINTNGSVFLQGFSTGLEARW
jgi:hypothetical protein